MPLVRQALTAGVGQILVQAENFRKKFRIPPNQQLRVPIKHAASIPSSHFGSALLGHFQKLRRHKRSPKRAFL
jgi:hypothetical protein